MENYVFKETDLTIMYDVKSGCFLDISNAEEAEYDKLYCNVFSDIPSKKDCFACEGTRLGRVSFVTTQGCNLKCKYCFAEGGTYNSTKQVIMSADTMKDAFRYLCEKYPDGINLVHFFGGEPMIGYGSIREFVAWCSEFCEKNDLVMPKYSIVTNGTIMDDNVFGFLNEYGVNMVVSIDGTKELNDHARISNTIKSVYDRIVYNFKELPSERNFKIGCELTINKIHILKYKSGIVKEWLDDVRSIGFNYVTIGVAETDNPECKITIDDKETLQSIEREVIDYFFNRYLEEDDFISVEIMSLLRQMAKKTKALSCGAGYNSITVMPTGEILPCYQFYHDDKFLMGRITETDEIKFEKIKEKFKTNFSDDSEDCRECWMKNQCTIHCKGFSYNSSGSLSSVAHVRCWLLEAAMKRLMYNIAKLKKDEDEYNKFIDKLYQLNSRYAYNKRMV